MQVQNTQAGTVARAYGRQAGAVATGAPPPARRSAVGAPRTDSVAVSSTLQDVSRLRAVVDASGDVRPDRVATLTAAIADGSYSVDTTALAAALLGGPG